LLPGEYRLRWQVLASDGHITRGEISFAVSGA
jgi:methionine-rich copper-binding protein CopC